MNDRDKLPVSEASRRWRLSPISIILIVSVLVGAYVSAGYSRTLSRLLRERREFAEVFGEMAIEDPSQVAIVAVAPTAVELPPWVDPENVSIFRVHIPANYGLTLAINEQLVAADSPLSTNGGSSSSYPGEPAAREIQIIVSTNREDGHLKGSLLTNSGSSPFSFTNTLAKSPEDLVLDTVTSPGQPARTFAIDEAICLWRLRNKEPSNKMLNQNKLYSGCAIYLHERSRSEAFNRWSNGSSSSMKGSAP